MSIICIHVPLNQHKLSDCGDVYVWGWNVNGQLGLPTGTITTHPDTATGTCSSQSNNESSISVPEEFDETVDDHDARLNNCQTTCSCAEECSQLKIHACKRKIGGSYEESNSKRQEVDSNLIDSLGTGTTGRQGLFVEKVFTQKLKHVSQSSKGSNVSDCVSRLQTDDLDCEGIKYYQSVDCVQTQTVPYGLDLGDKMIVKTVSCGTRHTCILSGKISRHEVIVISNHNRLLNVTFWACN